MLRNRPWKSRHFNLARILRIRRFFAFFPRQLDPQLFSNCSTVIPSSSSLIIPLFTAYKTRLGKQTNSKVTLNCFFFLEFVIYARLREKIVIFMLEIVSRSFAHACPDSPLIGIFSRTIKRTKVIIPSLWNFTRLSRRFFTFAQFIVKIRNTRDSPRFFNHTHLRALGAIRNKKSVAL